MSWAKRSQELLYRDFTEKAAEESAPPNQQPWSLEVWDVAQDGQLREYVQTSVRRLVDRPQLRIVFAPTDAPLRETKGLMVELFHRFGIPHEFTAERARSTSHSFGRRSDDSNCFSSWFRFSGISAEAGADDECLSVEVDAAEGASSPDKYPEQQSAFFLRTSNDASTTLVCFGARLGVRRRMKDLIKSRGWADVGINPYVLFDVVLEGLYEEVDSTASKLVREFASLERSIIRLGDTECTTSSLGELYLVERRVTELSRALESVLMINDCVLFNAGTNIPIVAQTPTSIGNSSSNRRSLVDQQLKECLEYHRSLFRSTQLRLSNLGKRIAAATTLLSNLAIQQQSAAVIQGPVSMKLIAASIIVFLPTITVATIAGSQLLLSEQRDEEDSWDVSATPLFYLLWYISIPLTVAVIILSLGWLWWRQGEGRRAKRPSSWFGKAMRKKNNQDSGLPV